MSYRGIEKTKQNLPIQARNIEPVSGWPICKKNKTPVELKCTVCGFIFKKSWDQLSHPGTKSHCDVCRNVAPLVSKFNNAHEDHQIINYRHAKELDKAINPTKTGITNYGCIVTLKHVACGHTCEINARTIKSIISPRTSSTGKRVLNCQHCNEKVKQQKLLDTIQKHKKSEQIKRAKVIWGKNIEAHGVEGGIYIKVPSFEGKYLPGNIPVAAILDENDTGRLKGKLDGVFSEAKLKKMLDSDERTMVITQDLIDMAPIFGATMLYICYQPPANNTNYLGSGVPKKFPKKQAIYYTYEKVTAYHSNWQTSNRIKETNFGRTGIKKEQMMIACVLAELFPINEHGVRVKWQQDSRSVFENNFELDIRSLNLLPHLHGIQCEYQGHQSHRECSNTKERDRIKKDNAQGFYLVIDKIDHMTILKALNKAEEVIRKSDFKHKSEFLKFLNPSPCIERIKNNFVDCIKSQAKKTTNEFKSLMMELGHKIISEQNYYLYLDNISYECASCGQIRNSSVKNILQTKPLYCFHCKSKQTTLKNQQKRCDRIRSTYEDFHLIEEPIPLIFLKQNRSYIQLTSAQRQKESNTNARGSISCAQCGAITSKKRYLGLLSKYKTFICTCCLNTGMPIDRNADNQIVMGSVGQNLDGLISVCSALNNINSFGDINDHISLSPATKQSKNKSRLNIRWVSKLGHEQTYTLYKWRKLLSNNSNCYCPECLINYKKQMSVDNHTKTLRIFHPDAEYIGDPSIKSLTEATCNKETKIGIFTIEHPPFFINSQKVKQILKTKKYGQYSVCLSCSEVHGWTPPSADKNIEQLEARLKLRAAKVATFLKDDTIDHVAIKVDSKTSLDKVTSDEKLSFYCHDKNHPPIVTSFNNYFSPYKKGYCPKCLERCGVKNYKELLIKL